MSHYGVTHRRDSNFAERQEILGANLYGVEDKKLGRIDDVIFDHTSGNIVYVVVDAGGWLKTERFLVPANLLSESARHEHDYVADLTKDQIEKFPAYDEQDLSSDEAWSIYEDRYRGSLNDGPVLHRDEGSRVVTPPPDQVAADPSQAAVTRRSEEEVEEDLRAAGDASDRVFPTAGSEWDRNPVGGNVGSRWENFQDSLRRRRKELTAECTRCGEGAQSEAYDSTYLKKTGT